MNIDIIKKIPELLENPIMITSSLSDNPEVRKNSIVIFSNLISKNKAVMFSMNVTNGTGEITEYTITGGYGRSDNALQRYLSEAIHYYIEPNKKITTDWLSALRVQFPSSTTKYGYNKSLPAHMRKSNSENKKALPLR